MSKDVKRFKCQYVGYDEMHVYMNIDAFTLTANGEEISSVYLSLKDLKKLKKVIKKMIKAHEEPDETSN